MPSFVKTEKDEKLWQRAKQKVVEQTDKSEEDEDFPWPLVTHIFNNMKKAKIAFDIISLSKQLEK